METDSGSGRLTPYEYETSDGKGHPMTDRPEREVEGLARRLERRADDLLDPDMEIESIEDQNALREAADALRTLTAERDRLKEALTVTREAMALFASVAQSGEQWSDRCQEALHRAIDAARALEPETEE